MDVREVQWEGMEWMHLAKDRVQWWALVKMVLNIQVL
jgi:hypothetical protein